MKDKIEFWWRSARLWVALPFILLRQHIEDRRRDQALTLLFYSRGQSEVALSCLINHALGRRTCPVGVMKLAAEMAGEGKPDWAERLPDA